MAKRKAGKGSSSRILASTRVSDLTTLFGHRYGRNGQLPEGDEGYQAARVMVHHIGRLKHGQRRMSDWLLRCAPWMSPREHERLLSEVEECPLKWSADKLAWKLRVTQLERDNLGITTIGAIDMPKAERIKRRAQAKRDRMRAIRRAKGAMSRAEYREAVRSAKPWEAEGLSRASWYRKRRVRQ